jgi:hypothetical protein
MISAPPTDHAKDFTEIIAEEIKSMEIPPHFIIVVMVLLKVLPIAAMDVKLPPQVMMTIANNHQATIVLLLSLPRVA